jgi:hypothetical protein
VIPEPPYVAPPIYVPPIAEPPVIKKPVYEPIGDVTFGEVTTPILPGLNPGFFVNVPEQYATTSPVQARYGWAPKAYQTGATFSPEQYRLGQPAKAWGLQQMYTPLNIQEYIRQQALATQRAVAPAPAPGPVKPV